MKLGKVRHLHFVGIGGTGMCGIAEVLLNMGYKISGSDLRRSEVTDRLEQIGAGFHEGHAAANVAEADVVVMSSAVREDNVEITRARELAIPVIRRAEMLAELMRMKFGIAVAGTHGKTTTTSMIGKILTEGGLDPTIIVGGRVRSLHSSSKLGQGDYLVAEADEFDRSFLRLAPGLAVVTTIEAEHLDIYGDLDEIKRAFVEFVNKVPFHGRVIICADDPGTVSIIPDIERSLVTYGISQEADLTASDIIYEGFGSRYQLILKGERVGTVALQVPGEYNLLNSLAAAAAGLEVGLPPETIGRALGAFNGVHRRFEIKGRIGGVTVVDDYAHHPTEIKASLRGARQGWSGRIVAVFQPHLYSRTRDFYEEFGRSFADSDVLVVTDVFPAREKPIEGISGELVAKTAESSGHGGVHYLPDTEEISAFLKDELRPGDLMITLGAGDIWRVGEAVLAETTS